MYVFLNTGMADPVRELGTDQFGEFVRVDLSFECL